MRLLTKILTKNKEEKMAISSQTNLFTTSVSWGGKENLEAFLYSLSEGTSPLATDGLRIIDNVQSTYKINLFDAVNKKTKAYATGFSGGTGATYTQKTLTVTDCKAEAANSAQEFAATVFETARKKGVAANDITDTVLENIIMEVWMRGVRQDIFRIFWLGDTGMYTIDSSDQWTATANTDYNMLDGMWKKLMDSAATSPTSSQIYRKAMDHGAVAQVTTVTLNATGSTAVVIDVNGTDYTTTWDTDYATTAAAFVTEHAATILAAYDIVVLAPTAAMTFTANTAGVPHTVTIASASSVGATVAATTANTAPTALAADEAKGYLQDLFVNSPKQLVAAPTTEKVFYVDYNVYHNYLESIEDGGTYTEFAKGVLINGMPALFYRGVPVIPLDWNTHLDADFPAGDYTMGRIIYTLKDNLIMGIDAESDFAGTEFWYEKLYEQNFMRSRFRMGAQFIDPKLVSVSY